MVRQRNLTRHKRFTCEQQALSPLPWVPLSPCRELRVTVSRERSIQVVGNTYSVPSRLIGTQLLQRASTTSATEVETALGLLAEAGHLPSFDTVRDLVALPPLPLVSTPPVQLASYDQRLSSRRTAHG